MPLSEKYFDEIVEDIRLQHKRNIAFCPLFIFVLLPEGNPVWDKASSLCELYRRYKKELDKIQHEQYRLRAEYYNVQDVNQAPPSPPTN